MIGQYVEAGLSKVVDRTATPPEPFGSFVDGFVRELTPLQNSAAPAPRPPITPAGTYGAPGSAAPGTGTEHPERVLGPQLASSTYTSSRSADPRTATVVSSAECGSI